MYELHIHISALSPMKPKDMTQTRAGDLEHSQGNPSFSNLILFVRNSEGIHLNFAPKGDSIFIYWTGNKLVLFSRRNNICISQLLAIQPSL